MTTQTSSSIDTVGLLGFGEVGTLFGGALAGQRIPVMAWDKLLAHSTGKVTLTALAQQAKVALAKSVAEMCVGTGPGHLVISAVTASNTLAAAQAAAPHMAPDSWYLDLNSASPGTKKACARVLEAKGVRYVEAGVMTSVPPYGLSVPMLLGGQHAHALAVALNAWGCNATVASTALGVASAIKMCRSIMIKGLESLVIESYTTARSYGVEAQVLPTLAETFPGIDWTEQGRYFFSRVAQHGQRRAEEMRESAVTVSEADLEPIMASAIASKQQWVADAKRDGVFAALPKDAPWQAYADALIAARLSENGQS